MGKCVMLPWYQSVYVLETFLKQTVSEFLLQLQFKDCGKAGRQSKV